MRESRRSHSHRKACPSTYLHSFSCKLTGLMGNSSTDINWRIVQACRKMNWHNYAIVGKVPESSLSAALSTLRAFRCLIISLTASGRQPRGPSLGAMQRPS